MDSNKSPTMAFRNFMVVKTSQTMNLQFLGDKSTGGRKCQIERKNQNE